LFWPALRHRKQTRPECFCSNQTARPCPREWEITARADDAASLYQLEPGVEGQPFDTTFAPNDFESLLLHEPGHAIGLAHPGFDGSCPVMQIAGPCLGRINRELDPDDLAGAAFLYLALFADGFE